MKEEVLREVLLVENDENDIKQLMLGLRDLDCKAKISVVRGEREAIDFLFAADGFSDKDPNRLPKLIVLDLSLIKESGMTVLRKLKGDMRTRKIPVVALTSSSGDAEVDISYKLCANCFVSKPVDFDKLKDTIRKIESY